MALMPPSPVEAINVKYSTDDERMVLLCLFFPSIVAIVPFLPHWLDHTFYKRNLFFTQVILFVKLLVYFRNGFAPINVWMPCEVLSWNELPNIFTIILSYLQNSQQGSCQFGLYILQAGACYISCIKCSNSNKWLSIPSIRFAYKWRRQNLS